MTSFSSYCLNFTVKNIPGSIMSNTISSQTSELLGNFSAGFLYSFLKAKRAFIVSFSLAIVGCLILMISYQNLSVVLVAVFVIKLGVSACFTLSYISFIKLIPYAYNTSVFGLSNVLARVITILAPLIAE